MTAIQPVNIPRPVKLTLDQFELLERTGAFDSYAKTELIEGAIYAMNSQFVAHAFAKSQLGRRLGNALEAMGSPLQAIVEGTVAMPPNSAPQPDIALAEVGPGIRAYMPLERVALVVEVSDSTAAFDLGEKAALYARHGVPEYWVLEMPTGTLQQLWSPAESGYRESRSIEIGGPAESVTISGLAVATDGLI